MHLLCWYERNETFQNLFICVNPESLDRCVATCSVSFTSTSLPRVHVTQEAGGRAKSSRHAAKKTTEVFKQNATGDANTTLKRKAKVRIPGWKCSF